MRLYILIAGIVATTLLYGLVSLVFSDTDRIVYALGDMDFDRDVDFADFLAFSKQYDKPRNELEHVVFWTAPPHKYEDELQEKHAVQLLGIWKLQFT